MRYRVLLLDLFGTVVFFSRTMPTIRGPGGSWRLAMQWLREPLREDLPETSFDAFLEAMAAVTEEIAAARAPEFFEVPSRERFRRTLDRLGVTGDRVPGLAERLSLMHMSRLAACAEFPPAYGALLRALAGRRRLGLVSNFDHGPTARAILARHDIASMFSVTVISDEVGRRKPHPAVFIEALRALESAREEALFVGDTLGEDVVGAQAAGIDVAWINASGVECPPTAPRPTYEIRSLADLPGVIG